MNAGLAILALALTAAIFAVFRACRAAGFNHREARKAHETADYSDDCGLFNEQSSDRVTALKRAEIAARCWPEGLPSGNFPAAASRRQS